MSATTPRRNRATTAPLTEPRSTRRTPKSTKSTTNSNPSAKSRSRSTKASDSQQDTSDSHSTDDSTRPTRRSTRLTVSQETTDQSSSHLDVPASEPSRPVSPIVQSSPVEAPFAQSSKVARTPLRTTKQSNVDKSTTKPSTNQLINESSSSQQSTSSPSNEQDLPDIPSIPPVSTTRSPVKRPAVEESADQSLSDPVVTSASKKRKSSQLESTHHVEELHIHTEPHTIPASLSNDDDSIVQQPTVKHSPVKQSPIKQAPIKQSPTKQKQISQSNQHHEQPAQQPISPSQSPRRTSISRAPEPAPEPLAYPITFPDVDEIVENLLESINQRISTSIQTLHAELTATHHPKEQIEAISGAVYDSVGETFDLTRPQWAQYVKKIVFSITEDEKPLVDEALTVPTSVSDDEKAELSAIEADLDAQIAELQHNVLYNRAILQKKRDLLNSIESQLTQHEHVRSLFTDASPARAAAFHAKMQAIKLAWAEFQATWRAAKESKDDCGWSAPKITDITTVKTTVTYDPTRIEPNSLMALTNKARLPM